MKRRTILMVCLLLMVAAGALAQHWSVNPRAFQYDMTAYVRVAGVASQADCEVAAFSQADECRGVGRLLTAADGTQVFQLRIRSNQAGGERIGFRVYRVPEGQEYWTADSLTFEAQSMAGTPSEPLELTAGIVLTGDVNGDGLVNIADAIGIVNRVVRKESAIFIEGVADVNQDGQVDIADAIAIVNIVVRKNQTSVDPQ